MSNSSEFDGRPSLTQAAQKYNAPRHWGNDFEASIGLVGTEIMPLKNEQKSCRSKMKDCRS